MNSTSLPNTNALTKGLFDKLKRHPKRIVFADGEDKRVIEAAAWLSQQELIAPVLLGDKKQIKALAKEIDADMTFVHTIFPREASDFRQFCERLEKVERYRGRVVADIEELVANPQTFASMMCQYSQVDGMVSGNMTAPASIFRAVQHYIKPLSHVPSLFSVVVMVSNVSDGLNHFGSEGMLFMSDCGITPDPSVDQLASYATETGKLAKHFLEKTPRVALLSHSTDGSLKTESSQKVTAATAQAKYNAVRQGVELDIIGEVQADVALDPLAAEQKGVLAEGDSTSSDVLIFPNLDAGHITFKILQHVAGVQHYGQLIMGLCRPAAQVPMTSTVETIIGTAALVGVEAIKHRELYQDLGVDD